MLDVFETLDLADRDNQLKLYREQYVDGEIEVSELERAIDARLSELQYSDEAHRERLRADLVAAMDAEVERIAASKAPIQSP